MRTWIKKNLWNIVITVLLFLFVICLVAIFTPGFLYNNWKMNRGHVNKIDLYFQELEKDDWNVDRTEITEEQLALKNMRTGQVRIRETYTWKARPSQADSYTVYSWELLPINGSTFEYLKSKNILANGWWQNKSDNGSESLGILGMRSILLPLNKDALAIHKEIGLRLPEGFELD